MNSRRSKPLNHKLKGIDAFIGSAPQASHQIATDQIQLPSSQPRRYFDEDKLQQLTESVQQHGIIEPLLVRPVANDKYELVAGERRYRAAIAAGLTEVPVVVKQLTNTEAVQLALIENLQREDLNPVEETEGILQLLSLQLDLSVSESRQLLYQMKNGIEKNSNKSFRDNVIPNSDSQAQQTVQSVFGSLGQNWYSFTCNRLPLLNLPEDILEALRSGQIEYTKAKAIANVKDEAQRKKLLDEAIANSLSLSQIRELVKAAQPVRQKEDLQNRFESTYKRAKKSKQLWQDSKKRKKLESLLSQLDKLIESESPGITKASLEPIFEPVENEPEPAEREELSDQQLAEVLGVSNLILAEVRQKQKKPPEALAKKLKQWEIRGDRWVKKS